MSKFIDRIRAISFYDIILNAIMEYISSGFTRIKILIIMTSISVLVCDLLVYSNNQDILEKLVGRHKKALVVQ